MLDVSRPTLAQIENDNRPLKAHELKKISEIFDVSIDFLLSGKTHSDIIVSDEQKQSFKDLMIYILTKVWAKYNLGKTVLYKLLYFCEFDYFELYNSYLTWYPFIKLPMGPAPLGFDFLVGEMKEANQLVTFTSEYNGYYQQRFIPNVPVADYFTKQKIDLIDTVLEKYADYSAKEISDLSHEDKPRQIANDMELIGYDLVHFREYPFSPRARQQRLQQAQKHALMTWFFDDLANEPDLYEEYR